MNKLKTFFEKIKSLKHLPIYIGIAIAAIMCILFVTPKSKSAKTTEKATQSVSSEVEYVSNLENKLCSVLSNITGVSKVNVVISLKDGFSYKYATDTETKTVSTGGSETSVTTQTVILVSNQPVVEQEIYPSIKGVVVVAKGAEDVNVKMKILNAIETILQVDAKDISILA